MIIADECHYLKNGKALRTKAILPLLKNANRAILLSGTPAMSRPSELFWQLHALDHETWKDYGAFTARYCKGTSTGGTAAAAGVESEKEKNEDGTSADYLKVSNVKELYTVLHATLMIRREKRLILTTLPQKRRRIVWVDVDDEAKRVELKNDLAEASRASERATGERGDVRRSEGGKRGGAKVGARTRTDEDSPRRASERASEGARGANDHRQSLLFEP